MWKSAVTAGTVLVLFGMSTNLAGCGGAAPASTTTMTITSTTLNTTTPTVTSTTTTAFTMTSTSIEWPSAHPATVPGLWVSGLVDACRGLFGGLSGAVPRPLGGVFGLPGGFLGPLGLLGVSWGLLGTPGVLLEPGGSKCRFAFPSEPPLGAVLGTSWAVVEASWAVLGPSWAVSGPSWRPLGPSSSDPGGLLGRLRASGSRKGGDAQINEKPKESK